MKNILSTWALLLVLPWKLTGETSLGPNSTRQHEDEHHETTIRGNETTMFSTKNIDLSLKPKGETSHSPSSTMPYESTYKHHETTKRGEETTKFSTKNNNLSPKPNSETSHSPSSTRLHNGTSKAQTTTRIDEPTTFFLKNQEKYPTEKGRMVSSSKSPPQTSEHHVTNINHGEHPTHAITISTGESKSSSHLSSLPIMTEMTHKTTDLMTITPLPQNMSEVVITTRDNQPLLNSTITSKGLNKPTPGNKTTRSAEKETFEPQTDISTHFQKTSSIFNQSEEITQTLTTKWSLLPQEKESTHLPKLNISNSNGTLDIINEGKEDTATYPLKTSTNTGFSTGHNPTVNTVVGTTGNTEAMVSNVTYVIATRDMITDGKPSTLTDNPKTTLTATAASKKNNPGPIVAALIGSILFLMFVAFVVVLVRSRKLKKKQMENSDWAGPSPFIEADIHPNLPINNEEEPFNRQEPKRISLYSFLPQQLTKRFSTMSPLEEVVPLENTQASSTFGQHTVQPLNGKATPVQLQTHEANSPPAELPSHSNVSETVSIPPALENNENIQTTMKLDEERVQSAPEETNNATPTPFEDVDLNLSVANDAESKTPADTTHIPSPPPPPAVTPS